MPGGAEYAYVLSALYRDRVLKLSFSEMLLSGVSLDEWSYFTPSNVNAQYEYVVFLVLRFLRSLLTWVGCVVCGNGEGWFYLDGCMADWKGIYPSSGSRIFRKC